MLDRLKAGDKIDFAADKINGAYTVTQVKPAR
jgi:Cu/Ag efflux protein CusF